MMPNSDATHHDRWTIVGTMPANISASTFWFVMENWTVNPQYIYTKIWKSDLIRCYSTDDDDDDDDANAFFDGDNKNNNNNQHESQSHETTRSERQEAYDQAEDEEEDNVDDDDDEGEDEEDPTRIFEPFKRSNNTDDVVVHVHRKLVPRYIEKDAPVEELVLHNYKENKVIYMPLFPHVPEDREPTPDDLPFYYPKVMKYSIELVKCNNGGGGGNEKNNNNNNSSSSNNNNNDDDDDANNNSNSNRSNNNNNNMLVLSAVYFPNKTFNYMSKISQVLLKKLLAWGRNHEKEGGYKKRVHHDVVVPKDMFFDTYKTLKRKYKYWVDQWEECTDPSKFVFEDVAIAAFFICLCEMERKRESLENNNNNNDDNNADNNTKPSFVDLGCGNGFLVYLLIEEGFRGTGIDLRERKIWHQYPRHVQERLHVQEFRPDTASFPGVDWIIGNHSDELTPWIPLIAARSSSLSRPPKMTKYFVLPCCFFDFDRRFTDHDQSIGRYKTYLNYIESIGRRCGFDVETEHLRIPSTKNVAQIARRWTRRPAVCSSTQVEEKEEEVVVVVLERQIQALLRERNFVRFQIRVDETLGVHQPRKKRNPNYKKEQEDEKMRQLIMQEQSQKQEQ